MYMRMLFLPVELDGRKVDVEYVDGILKLLGLSEKKEALPGTLSGGQQQRLRIAGRLRRSPQLFWLMNRREIWIRLPAMMYLDF